MKVISAEFIKSAIRPNQYPPADHPEVAFSGRSNVGKSSLINTLVNRKSLVKISRTPGRTQLINFFLINENVSFVDLPGYGYAKVPDSVRKQWGPMVETYLAGRESLKGVCVLMDIRRNPGVEERHLMQWLDYHSVPYILVLTKADKLSRGKQQHRHRSISETLGEQVGDPIIFSAKSRQGKDALWQALTTLLQPVDFS